MEGTVVGRYKLIRRLAAGGMGEVYLAAQTGPAGFEKVVALKRMLPTMAGEREVVRLFLDEARLVARLAHRNICQIVELGEDGDGYFVAMEYIQGPSVRGVIDRMAESGLMVPPALAVDIAAQVADALGYAYHAPGRDGEPLRIIHRDVTPQNVLISISGDVKLIDFGVAKSADQSHVTQSGTVKGKLAYMSPEQSRGAPLDQRSDLFSLGVVLAEMLTGKNPYARSDVVQTVMAIQGDPPPPLSNIDPSLAPADAVVARLLARNPEDRFPDANEVFEELTAVRSKFPRPPKRLGPFVGEHFSADIQAAIKAVTDSGVRSALRRNAEISPPSGHTPATSPARQAASARVVPTSDSRRGSSPRVDAAHSETFVRPDESAETRIKTPAAESIAVLEGETDATPPSRTGVSSWTLGGIAAVIVIAGGGAMFALLRVNSASTAGETSGALAAAAPGERSALPAPAGSRPGDKLEPGAALPEGSTATGASPAAPPQVASATQPTPLPAATTAPSVSAFADARTPVEKPQALLSGKTKPST